MNRAALWQRYKESVCVCDRIGLSLDLSRMYAADSEHATTVGLLQRAFDAMDALERGAIANADEQRRVGHYWLRAPQRAPAPSIREEIQSTIDRIRQFAADVHAGVVNPPTGDGFYVTLLIGIGGSALGPEFLCDALASDQDPMFLRVIDNTDPDGIDRIIADIGGLLSQTLTVVVSKSGGTKETRNGMIEVEAAYRRAGLDFAKHAVAITQLDSTLDQRAANDEWLACFSLWDWVGGRTSITSSVGLLPAALLGIDINAFLTGAREADECTRERDLAKNPAALMALAWHSAIHQAQRRAMVVLPYRDRLALFGKYLQQLIMESIGKRLDRDGLVVHEGLTVYGNKGSSDQHAYVQQLIEGPDDFFATFIEVLHDRDEASRDAITVEDGVTAGDFLHAFLHGTRDALTVAGRPSMTITLDRLDARRLGSLIAVFERAVGLYAELINVNAYHQPGVEAGKKAADDMIRLQSAAVAFLNQHATDLGSPANRNAARGNGPAPERAGHTSASTETKAGYTAEQIADAIGEPDRVEAVYHILRHLSANPHRGIMCQGHCDPASDLFAARRDA